jgi:hypothetical protein
MLNKIVKSKSYNKFQDKKVHFILETQAGKVKNYTHKSYVIILRGKLLQKKNYSKRN